MVDSSLASSGPKFFSLIATARRKSGSASAVRLRFDEQPGQAAEGAGHSGMVGPQARLLDGERPAKDGLGLAWPAGGREYERQIGKGRRYNGMVSAEPSLLDCERAPEERLSLWVPVTEVKEEGEAVERHRYRGIVWADVLLLDRQSAAIERFGRIQRDWWPATAEPGCGARPRRWGAPGQEPCSLIARARRNSGSASSNR